MPAARAHLDLGPSPCSRLWGGAGMGQQSPRGPPGHARPTRGSRLERAAPRAVPQRGLGTSRSPETRLAQPTNRFLGVTGRDTLSPGQGGWGEAVQGHEARTPGLLGSFPSTPSAFLFQLKGPGGGWTRPLGSPRPAVVPSSRLGWQGGASRAKGLTPPPRRGCLGHQGLQASAHPAQPRGARGCLGTERPVCPGPRGWLPGSGHGAHPVPRSAGVQRSQAGGLGLVGWADP